MNILTIIASVALGLTSGVNPIRNPDPEKDAIYRLRIEADAPRVVHIDAEIPCADGRLTIGEQHPEPKQRWSDYVDGLEITTSDGEPVSFERSVVNQWALADPVPERVRVRYRLRLEHDAVRWPPSTAEATYFREDCVFFRGYAVLIGNRAIERTRILLDLPEKWEVTTPLASTKEAPREFTSGVRFDAFNSGFMIGTHATARINLDGIQVDLGVSRDLPGALEEMVVPFRAALIEAKQVFGGSLESRYAIIAAGTSSTSGTGGSGMSNGMSMLLGRNPVDDPGGIWNFTLVHELLHMWLGSLIRCGSDTQWFNEGMADYLALIIGGRNGLFRKNLELGYMGQMWSGYLKLAGNRSMAAAGGEKTRFYNFIYGGGMHIGLLLDIELRRATDGERSIDDLMQAVNKEFGGTGKRLKPGDVQRIANALAGDEDLSWIFEDFVLGEETLPSELVHKPVGLMEKPNGTGGMRLVRDPKATPRAVALRKTIFGID